MARSTSTRPRSTTRIGYFALAVGILNLLAAPLWISGGLGPMALVPALLTAVFLLILAALCFAVARSMLRKPTPREIESYRAQASATRTSGSTTLPVAR